MMVTATLHSASLQMVCNVASALVMLPSAAVLEREVLQHDRKGLLLEDGGQSHIDVNATHHMHTQT